MNGNKSVGARVLLGAGSVEQAFESWVRRRRLALFAMTAGLAGLGCYLMVEVNAAAGWTPLRAVSFSVFSLLFASLCFGFTQAFVGFLALAERHEPLKITNTLDPSTPLASTAVVMPVYNEDPHTVFGNVRTLLESLSARGELDPFEFYILSDSTDPSRAVQEELAWADLCRQTNGFGRIHYRRRTVPVNRKSGNIADFCRRWGHRHRYMVVLDADSVMTGEAVASLVRMMEVNHRAGIIQTMPRLAHADTLFGRIQQFASRAYSPIFAAGLNFWQQGAGNYWGHNAIIRIAPFLAGCGLPALPGSEPLGGRVLSHDFVEAALMRAHGWEVWFAYDLEGSYEGLPPNLSEYVKRDRRWCQGNLQHAWFLLTRNLAGLSRLHLVQGILAYASAPLLALFIFLTGIQGAIDRLHPRAHASVPASALMLFVLTVGLLFGPKVLSFLHLTSRRDEVRRFGGAARLAAGMALETVFSVLASPVLLWFHTRFVLRNLSGQTVSWHTQTRDGGSGPRWSDVWTEYWPLPVAAVVLGGMAWLVDPNYALWLSPILLGLLLSPIVIQGSGRKGLLSKFFLTPEETAPPRELTQTHPLRIPDGDGFVRAILDPYANAVHVALQRPRGSVAAGRRAYVEGLADKAFRAGPGALSAREKRALLADAVTMTRLHTLVWKSAVSLMHPFWGQALEAYRLPGVAAAPSDGPLSLAA